MKKIMAASSLSVILIILGSVLLILTTIPVKNTIEDNTLTVNYIIGKKKIDITGAVFMPVPDEARHNLVRVAGTSIGKINSGNFKNYKTGTRFKFYLSGKGEQVYFEVGETKYLIDNLIRK